MSSELDPSLVSSLATKQAKPSKLKKIEWLGQTIASLCWIISMFVYGLDSKEGFSPGDWLQLAAGLAWFIANIASLNDN